jgi:hypothetical protein
MRNSQGIHQRDSSVEIETAQFERNTPTRFVKKIETSKFTRNIPTRFITRNWAQTICKRYTHETHHSKLRLNKSQGIHPRDSSHEIGPKQFARDTPTRLTTQIARDTPTRFISRNGDLTIHKGNTHVIHLASALTIRKI